MRGLQGSDGGAAHGGAGDGGGGPLQHRFKTPPRRGIASHAALALRFTAECGRVRISCVPDDDGVRVSVADDGIGLASENFERVFDEFFQVEDHLARRHGGLGLTIARRLAEADGGRLWAASAGPGAATTFHFVLPLPPDGG